MRKRSMVLIAGGIVGVGLALLVLFAGSSRRAPREPAPPVSPPVSLQVSQAPKTTPSPPRPAGKKLAQPEVTTRYKPLSASRQKGHGAVRKSVERSSVRFSAKDDAVQVVEPKSAPSVPQLADSLVREKGPISSGRALKMAEVTKRLRRPKQKPPRDLAKLDHIGEDLPRDEPVEEQHFDGFENRAHETPPVVAQQMIETRVDPMSTFAIDVDTGGYTLARARLREGYRPRAEDVRIEEFLNYFQYDYGEPQNGAFAVKLEAAPDPFSVPGESAHHLIRVGVRGRSVPDDARPPAHLTFLIDVSGSMFGPDRLGLVIESLDLVRRHLRPDDTLALVTYANGAHVRLWPAGASESDLIAATIASLEAGGSSALDEGLGLAYQVASTHYHAGHINRVVLLGDGRANVGETGPDELLASVSHGVEDGVMLSTIGFGARAFNDHLMEQLADRGNGSYFFVDSFREAQRVFGDRLCGTLYTIAKDVKIQVEFNPETVVRHRLLGYENRRLEHEQFRDDAVDAGEIGAGHSVTALYEVELAPAPTGTLAMVHVRYKEPDESRATETSYELFSEELVDDVREATADFEFAAAVALFAEVVRGDEPGGADRISLIREIASEGVPDPERQPDRAEFLALLDEAAPYYSR